MNYLKIYNDICVRGKNRVLNCYFEKHHIIPKSMGGSNHDDNLTKLTAREHFLCHLLLCEIYPINSKLKYASWAMVNQKSNSNHKRTYKISARLYERLKIEFSKNHSKTMSGKKHSKITIEKMKKPKTELHKKKIGKGNIGKIRSIEHKNAIINSLLGNTHRLGKHHSDKTKEKIRKSSIGRIVSKETRKKLKTSNSKKVYQYSINGIFIKEWQSGNIASKELKIDRTGISSCISGKLKQSGNYIWKLTEHY